MADEKTFIIPLRKEFMKAPNYKRTKKAVSTIREYLKRHMKSDNIKIGKHLNLKLWEHGRKNPPIKIKIKAIKEEDIVRAELPEFEFETSKKKEKKKPKTETLKDRLIGKQDDKKDMSLLKHQKKEKKKLKEERAKEKKEPKEKLEEKVEEKPKKEIPKDSKNHKEK